MSSVRLAANVVLLALLSLAFAAQAFAASTGTLRVTVVDLTTKAPLVFAQVDIYGSRSLRGSSGVDGVVSFDRLAPGKYAVEIEKAGYLPQTLRNIALTVPQTNFVVLLRRAPRQQPDWFRTIGTVTSKAKSKSSSTQSTSDGPEAKLSNSMVDALATLPGVVLQRGGFAQYPSIDGHPATQTALTIEGVPVSGFGSAPNLQAFNLDLFDSVSVNQGSAYGSTGGTINFQTRDPTLDWIGTGKPVEGAFGNAGLTLTEEGTTGRLGLSFTHAMRDEGNPLDGMRFLDSSGLDYSHDVLAHTSGDAFKLRYPFSLNNILFASFVSIGSSAPMFCVQFTGPLPCGYGPLNNQDSTLASAQLRDVVAAGRLGGTVSIFHNRNSLDVDQSGRYVNGLNLPQ